MTSTTRRSLFISGDLTAFEKGKLAFLIENYDSNDKKQRRRLREFGLQAPSTKCSKKRVTLMSLDVVKQSGKVKIEEWRILEYYDIYPKWHFDVIDFTYKVKSKVK